MAASSIALAAAFLFLVPSLRALTGAPQPGRVPADGDRAAHGPNAIPGRPSQVAPPEPSPTFSPGAAAGRASHAPTLGAATPAAVAITGQAISCTDARTGSAFQYQAQHLLSSGLVDAGWTSDSTQLCLGSEGGTRDLIIPDGSGGAYAAWVDNRLVTPDIYVQHFTSSGAAASGWPDGGMAVCTAPLSQYNLDACADGAGGVILAWQDFRSGGSQVYVERVGPDHAPASGWSGGGVLAAAGTLDQYSPCVTPDGAGGAFVLWQSRETSGLGARIQHLDASGSVASGWPAAGAALLSGATHVAGISASRDNSGKLDVAWRCAPDTTGIRLITAKLDPSSPPSASWGSGPITLGSGARELSEPRLIRCSNGGLLIGWAQLIGATGQLRAEQLDANGAVSSGWPATGATVSATAAISSPALLPISGGGAFVAWEDVRTVANPDIYAMRLGSDGSLDASWDSSGVAICTAAGVQYAPGLSADGNGGAIVVWSDASTDASGNYLAARKAASDPTRLLHVETNSEYAKLTWAVPASSGEVYRAYRMEPSGDWTLMFTVAPDDSAHAVLEDKAAPGGSETQYRLAMTSQGVIRFLTPVTVEVPGDPARLELTRAWPSPGHDGIQIAFALPRGPAARVDVFDVMGRHVGGTLLDRFAPGTYETHVPMSPRPAASVYFVRLSQGSRFSTRKVVFLK